MTQGYDSMYCDLQYIAILLFYGPVVDIYLLLPVSVYVLLKSKSQVAEDRSQHCYLVVRG